MRPTLCQTLLATLLAVQTVHVKDVHAAGLLDMPLEQLMTMEVQSASKYVQPAIDAPAAVAQITADDIRTYGYRTLGEIIAAMPGLYTSYDRYFTYVGTRGFARPGDYNSRILLLIDGIRQNDAIFSQALVGSESPLDVDLIDRVEFVPGGGSSIYGANAFFGVLNVITKNGGDLGGGELAGAVGSYRTGKARLSYGKAESNGSEWLVSASGYYQGGQDLYFPAHGGTARDLDRDRSTSFFAKYTSDNLTLSALVGSRNKQNPTASFDQAFNAPGSNSTDESAALAVQYRKTLNDSLHLTVRGNAQLYRNRGDFIYDRPPRYINRDHAEGTLWDGEVQFTSTHFAGHRIVFGLEHRRDDRVRQRNYDVDPYVSYLDRRDSAQTTGIYVQDEITFSERWLLNLGVRRDQPSEDAGATSPRLGLIFKPQPQTAFKLLYGEAYRPPNAFERYYATDTSGGFLNSPDLKPEQLRSREFVIEHALSASQRIVFSAYRNDVQDLIAQKSDSAADRFYYTNVGDIRSTGSEIRWQARLPHGLHARLSASWQRTEDQETGQRITNSPARQFKANLSMPFANEVWRAGLEVQAMSRRDTWQGTAPGFAVTNLTFSAPRLTRNVELSASVYNLFDRRYYDPAGEELSPSDRVEQNGRNFRLKLIYRF